MAEKEYKEDMKHNLAEMYAKNMVDYGVDVTKAWQTATQQSYALEKAYIRGRQYEADRFIELRKEYNDGWIPCKDRLPEEVNKYYLVTYRSVIFGKFEQHVTVSYLSTFSNGDKSWEIEEEHGNNRMVIAWQPLPEPFMERD